MMSFKPFGPAPDSPPDPCDVRKVIAVHLNYRSRAEQRGRTPDHLSFFLKPGTSVTTSGQVARPAGTELLTFEGEIAIVIGATAKAVSVQDAWSRVAGVTAANDLGLQDLRAADRGSNLRSKGADGFTPLGPRLLPAADVDPLTLRVRTWHNGTLVQDESAQDLIFSLAQVVSDASELITLERGDVILAGTPAGASVADTGDVIEVEVTAAGGASTGRLVTQIVDGPALHDPTIAQVTDSVRADAWGRPTPTAETAGPQPPSGLDAALLETLHAVSTATLSSVLRKRGLVAVTMDGLAPTRPGSKLVGTARTLRFIGFREDLFAGYGGGFNQQKQAFDSIDAGEVLVIEARQDPTAGTLGDILALRAAQRGAAGVVTDGAVRDYATVAAIDLPVFSNGAHSAVLGRRHVPWERDTTITCGGVSVQPGDVIVGDDDGVLVIPRPMVREVATEAAAQEREEQFIAIQVEQGVSVDGLYPMNPEWRERYATWGGPDAPHEGRTT